MNIRTSISGILIIFRRTLVIIPWFMASIAFGQTLDTSEVVSTVVDSTVWLEKQNQADEERFTASWKLNPARDHYAVRSLPDSVKENLLADDAFWYVNAMFEKEQVNPGYGPPARQGRPYLQMVLLALIVAGFGAFIWLYLFSKHRGIFRRSKSLVNEDEGTNTDNIFTIAYEREIDRAVTGGNYRLAVRLLFLRLLKELDQRNIVPYEQDKTNLDYLAALRQTTYYNGFFRLARLYEYAWYGQFAVDREKFGVIQSDFEKFENDLQRR